jgi:hypothetical protein
MVFLAKGRMQEGYLQGCESEADRLTNENGGGNEDRRRASKVRKWQQNSVGDLAGSYRPSPLRVVMILGFTV